MTQQIQPIRVASTLTRPKHRSIILGTTLIGLLLTAPSLLAQTNLPSRSTTIATFNRGSNLIAVNTDNDSISVFTSNGNALQKLAEVPVGNEPGCVAVHPSGREAYVTNAQSGTVSA